MSHIKSVLLALLLLYTSGGYHEIMQENAAQDSERILRFMDHLNGKWKFNGNPRFEEWTRESQENALTGSSYKIVNNELVISETLEIVYREEQWQYIATVADQNNGNAIAFYWNPDQKEGMAFDNPEHDFPQRIEYRITDPSHMTVHVTDLSGKGFSLSLVRENN